METKRKSNQMNGRREEKRNLDLKKEKKMGGLRIAICFSCPPLGSKMEFENTTSPNGIRCVNESTLSLSLSPCPDLFNCGPSDVLTRLQCCATRVMVIWAPVDTGCFEIPSPSMWKYQISLKFLFYLNIIIIITLLSFLFWRINKNTFLIIIF